MLIRNSNIFKRRTAGGLVLALFFLSPGFAFADDKWRVFGNNEGRVDWYDVNGNEAASPYQSEGVFGSDRLNLNFQRNPEPGKETVIHAELLAADDPFLVQDGFVFERLQLKHQDGTAKIPYRFHAGDFFAGMSRRTLQRTIRGVSVELQPQNTSFGDQSILLLTGTGQVRWDETFKTKGDDLYFNGLSYLLTSKSGISTLGVNFVHAHQEGDTVKSLSPSGVTQDQLISSIMGETTLRGIKLEGEYAQLKKIESGNDRNGAGGYLQMSGKHGPFSGRFRFTRNDADFAPAGGIGIIANRRALELHSRYRLPAVIGGSLNLRLQEFRDNLEGPVPRLDTDILSVRYQGNLTRWRPSLQFQFGWDANELEAEDKSTNRQFNTYSFSMRDRFARGFYGNYTFSYRRNFDFNVAANITKLLDNNIALGRRFDAQIASHPVKFDIKLGVAHRYQKINSRFKSVQPYMDLLANHQNHALKLHYSLREQEFSNPSINDLQYQARRATYSYTKGPHVVSVEWSQDLRRPDEAERTNSNKLSFIYRYNFDTSL